MNILRLTTLILSLLIFIAPQKSSANDEIKIGVMLHLGGEFAAWGQAYLQGITLAQGEINNRGGIKGKQVSLVVDDIRFNPQLTATVSKKQLDIDHVPVSLISTFTEVQVAGPMFEKAHVPLIVIGDSDEQIDNMGDYLFSTGSWVKGYSVSASRFLRDRLKLNRVALIATNNPWSQATTKTFEQDFVAKGGTIVTQVDINPEEADFRTILLKLKTQNIDGIFAPLTANSVAFFKQAHQLKLGYPIVTAGAALDNDVIAAIPADVEGRYVTDAHLDNERPQAHQFLSHYREKYGKDPAYPSVSARGYDGMMTAVHAMETAADLTSDAIKDALYKVDFDGAGFHVHMSAEGGARLPVEVLLVKNGKLEKQ